MFRILPLALLLLPLAFSCEGDLELAGISESADGRLALLWDEPDRGLVHGEGELEAGHATLNLSNSPPPAAFRRGLAVAELVLLDRAAQVRLGQPLQGIRGVAASVVLVYRTESMAERWWSTDFPPGFSCAHSRVGADGEVGYSPVSCDGLNLEFVDRADLEVRPRRD